MLDQRAETILENIIDHYVNTAEPVGSRLLAKITELKMSAATIRNIMSDLTEQGLIVQPHVSAGRVPTDLGYRYYINKILNRDESIQYKYHTSVSDKKKPHVNKLEDILLEAAWELSSITACTGVVISPQPTLSRLKKIEFIKLSGSQVLVILITQIGMVYNKIVQLRKCPAQKILNKISRLLRDLFEGETITKIRETLVEALTEKKDKYDDLLIQATRLGKKAFDLSSSSELYVLGRSNMCSFPEFKDQKNLKIVYQLLDEKTVLLDILVDVMEEDGIQIKIGNENKYDGLEQCSIIAGTYGNKDHLLGSIGIIGPTRIDYSKIISEIDYSAQKLTDKVDQFLENS